MHPALGILFLAQYLTGRCDAVPDNLVVRETTDIPSPLVIPPSQYFEGNDGPWSTFNLRVGTPFQNVRVTISTASPETMVVLSEYGCSTSVFQKVPDRCASSRGLMFNDTASSTWNNQGYFGINQDGVGLEANLGYTQTALFGLETLGLGMVAGANGPTLENQTVAGLAFASPFYLGIFGLGTQPVNYTTLGHYSAPSYFTSLKSQNLIPSLSWSYTAGAMYRLKQVYGQLIFGGYDTSRFDLNPVSFTLAEDITRDIVVSLQSITYSGTAQTALLPDPILIFIDSTDPNIWLPEAACTEFEKAFGLTLDAESGLYLVNGTHRQTLLSENAEVSFRLSDTLTGGETVNINLPYAAFDLTAEYPIVNSSSYYFPLKKAANDTQYTLGRTFLQEAYLTVDYERGNFSVSQCTWVEGATANIVAIGSGNATSTDGATPTDGQSESNPTATPSLTTLTGLDAGNGDKSSSGLSTGAIAGISVAAAVIAIAAAVGGYFLLKRRREQQSAAQALGSAGPVSDDVFFGDAKSPEQLKLAALAGVHGELSNDSQVHQLDGEALPCEAGGGKMDWVREGAHELPGSEVERPEMDGGGREAEMGDREERSGGVERSDGVESRNGAAESIPHVVSPL